MNGPGLPSVARADLTGMLLGAYSLGVTLDLPDIKLTKALTPEEIRIELACALYARGRIGKVDGAQLAGVDFFAFQRAMSERSIPLYTDDMLSEDLESLEQLFPR